MINLKWEGLCLIISLIPEYKEKGYELMYVSRTCGCQSVERNGNEWKVCFDTSAADKAKSILYTYRTPEGSERRAVINVKVPKA